MPSPRGHRFTIYDALEAGGYFDSNPANTFARDATTGSSLYKGPVEYPKMLYDPEGAEEVIRAGEIVVNALTGPALQNEQRQIRFQIVNSQEEEEQARAEGWWPHPAQAIRARVEARIQASPAMSEAEKAKLLKAVPMVSSENRIKDLEAQLEKLLAAKAQEDSRRGIDAPAGPKAPAQVEL